MATKGRGTLYFHNNRKNLSVGYHSIPFYPGAVQDKTVLTSVVPTVTKSMHTYLLQMPLAQLWEGGKHHLCASSVPSSASGISFLPTGAMGLLPQTISSRPVLLPSLWMVQGIWQLHSLPLTFIRPQEGHKSVQYSMQQSPELHSVL